MCIVNVRVVRHLLGPRRVTMVVWPSWCNLQLACAASVEVPALSFVDASDSALDQKFFKLLHQNFVGQLLVFICFYVASLETNHVCLWPQVQESSYRHWLLSYTGGASCACVWWRQQWGHGPYAVVVPAIVQQECQCDWAKEGQNVFPMLFELTFLTGLLWSQFLVSLGSSSNVLLGWQIAAVLLFRFDTYE